MTLGQIIRNYRTENGLTLKDFSEKSGITIPYLSMLENNKNTKNGKPIIPTYQTCHKAAIGMGVAIEWIIERVDDFPVTVTPKLVELSDEATLVAAAYDEADPELRSMVRRLLNVKKSTLSRLG